MTYDMSSLGKGSSFALSISDALPMDIRNMRLLDVMEKQANLENMGFVCIRNDSLDPARFAETAAVASIIDSDIILESSDPDCLENALGPLTDRKPILCITDASKIKETVELSISSGCPMTIPGDDVQSLMDNAETALDLGAKDIILNPTIRNMKACLETATDIWRLRSEHGICDHPVMTRAWSGEYALSTASVFFMRHGNLVVLDDLADDACRVLDTLIRSIR